MNEMKENIKVGLLAVIAVTLAIATFTDNGSSTTSTKSNAQVATAANPTANAPGITPEPKAAEKPAEKASKYPPTTMKFDRMEHDFGKVAENTKNSTSFTFTNTGNEPLVIETAKGSCGCTEPTGNATCCTVKIHVVKLTALECEDGYEDWQRN